MFYNRFVETNHSTGANSVNAVNKQRLATSSLLAFLINNYLSCIRVLIYCYYGFTNGYNTIRIPIDEKPALRSLSTCIIVILHPDRKYLKQKLTDETESCRETWTTVNRVNLLILQDGKRDNAVRDANAARCAGTIVDE